VRRRPRRRRQPRLPVPVERTILFTGDLGRNNLPILQDPSLFSAADYVVMESTYGDRVHEATADIPDALAKIINETRQAGGKVVIPAFAIERTQELIYYLSALFRAKKYTANAPYFLTAPWPSGSRRFLNIIRNYLTKKQGH